MWPRTAPFFGELCISYIRHIPKKLLVSLQTVQPATKFLFDFLILPGVSHCLWGDPDLSVNVCLRLSAWSQLTLPP